MLLNESALRKRIRVTLYSNLRNRAKPRLWKTGKKAGEVRVEGITELPFTADHLWNHLLNQIGPGKVVCPYCVEIGRKPNFISLVTCVVDHKIPVWKGGHWGIENLNAVCEDCNNCKGPLTYETFIAVMQFIEALPDAKDRSSLYSCLRSHGVSGRMRGFYKPKSLPANVVAEVNQLEF